MSCGVIILNNIQITGDCQNTGSGAFSFTIAGGVGPYSVSEFTTTGLIPPAGPVTAYTATSLTAGTYTVEILDSCSEPGHTRGFFNFTISSGSCVSIETSGTTCGLNNGSITANTSVVYGTSTLDLYDIDGNLIDSGNNINNTFNNLSPGLYYVIGNDGGGCTGKSEVCLIKESDPLDFGLFGVNDSSCVSIDGNGKIFVTGLTGTPPYTYNWTPNVGVQTGPEVIGLNPGTYGVTIIDANGCTLTKTITLSEVPILGVASILTTEQPSCFTNDGEVTVVLSGGTAPYYFSGSNGEIQVEFSNTHTFSGLPAGVFSVFVTDSGLCTTTASVSLLTPNGFIVTTLQVTNSNCNLNDGSVHIELNNGLAPGNFQYTLTDPFGNTTITTALSICDFGGLTSGLYTLSIQDIPNNSGCIFTTTFSVLNENKYTISTSFSDTFCGFNNGTVIITASSGGTLPLTYTLSGGTPVITITQLTNTFTNLTPGFYLASVSDSATPPCVQDELIYISPSQPVDIFLSTVQPVSGNDGEIFLNITDGIPPFTINWSPNVGLQTGLHLTNLSNGTYSVTVIDSSGCTKTSEVVLSGTEVTTIYESYTICSDDFVNTGTYGKRGILQMMNEGFFDLTVGNTGCVIQNATFTTQVDIDGNIKENLFYTFTGGTFGSFAEYLWIQSLRDTLNEYPEIGDVFIDVATNKITITNNCNEKNKNCISVNFNELADTNVKINLLIEYEIICETCGKQRDCNDFVADMTLNDSCEDFDADIEFATPTPTPSLTPTPTPNPVSCDCYLLSACIAGSGAVFTFDNCVPMPDTISVSRGNFSYVCASTLPILDSGVGNVNTSIYTCVDGICGPTPTATPTPTPTPTPIPVLGTCDVIVCDQTNVYGYFTSTNTETNLSPYITGWVSSIFSDNAHTSNKLWLLDISIGSNNIYEYDITLSPFTGNYNRTISFGSTQFGPGLAAINDTTLISVTGVTQVIEIDISGVSPSITNKFNIPLTREVTGDFIYTTSNKLIVTTKDDGNEYISQYDYTSGVQEVDIQISPTITDAFGLYTEASKIHIVTLFGEVWTIDETTPYGLNFLQTSTLLFNGASQLPSCNIINFT